MRYDQKRETEYAEEYCIYQRNGQGQPFIYHIYDNLEKAKIDLYNLVQLEKDRNRAYYVNNDFFENEYPSNLYGKFFCIRKRKVTEWTNYKERAEKEEKIENSKQEKNNIIYFEKYV